MLQKCYTYEQIVKSKQNKFTKTPKILTFFEKVSKGKQKGKNPKLLVYKGFKIFLYKFLPFLPNFNTLYIYAHF